ncbi:AraC family transcriptional regulator [Sphingorhabdus sp. Alg239-R122]|uniref:AraC family transcriptional regulator n=1 Tax=Sphingorhabdus sp. Alg239-R122 TaxID=2305989 RepID=UPI0013DB45C3|nr:AraC family transcriptional regulator [Sphingorhabdus sp. Alg239-R122]
MDILNDILDTLNLKGALYFRTDFSAPWSVTVPVLEQAARFHLVVQGQCHVTLPGDNHVLLNAGDLILIPRGQTHILSDGPVETAPSLETVLDAVQYDGEGVLVVGDGETSAATQLICGHFTFRKGADHPVLRALPDHVVITASMRAQNPWLDEILRMSCHRMFSDTIGSDASVRRLSEMMFIEVLRMGIEDTDGIQALLHGFQDPQIGKSLELIHKNSGMHWSVESLAAEVGMSRSRFADRFGSLIGQGPMSYLSDWRLQKALSLLDESNCSVQQVAVQTGYQSPAAFTRAFAGKFGIAPTKYRQSL